MRLRHNSYRLLDTLLAVRSGVVNPACAEQERAIQWLIERQSGYGDVRVTNLAYDFSRSAWSMANIASNLPLSGHVTYRSA